jgi:ribonucleotide monophosphatase NagD (HAD superfamily)
LWNNQIPFCFVTNGTYPTAALAENLSKILDLPLTAQHCVVAPSPCIALTDFHDKHVLVVCQDDAIDLISE